MSLSDSITPDNTTTYPNNARFTGSKFTVLSRTPVFHTTEFKVRARNKIILDGTVDASDNKIINVHAGTESWDAVNLKQLNDMKNELVVNVDQRISSAFNSVVDDAPAVLDTLKEVAAAINNDAGFAASVVTLSAPQTITGAKTFTDNIVVPPGSGPSDAVNYSQLNTEINRAQGQESTLSGLITVEATRAQGQEATLSGLIAAEANRAQGQEGTLSGSINSLSGIVSTGQASLSGLIAAEANRAQGQEATLSATVTAVQSNVSSLSGTVSTLAEVQVIIDPVSVVNAEELPDKPTILLKCTPSTEYHTVVRLSNGVEGDRKTIIGRNTKATNSVGIVGAFKLLNNSTSYTKIVLSAGKEGYLQLMFTNGKWLVLVSTGFEYYN